MQRALEYYPDDDTINTEIDIGIAEVRICVMTKLRVSCGSCLCVVLIYLATFTVLTKT